MVVCNGGCWGKGDLFFFFMFFFLYFLFFLFVFRLFSVSLVCFFLILVSVFVPCLLLSLFVFSFSFFVFFFHPFSLFYFFGCHPIHLLVRGVFIRGRGERATPVQSCRRGRVAGWLLCSCLKATRKACPLIFFISMVGHKRGVGCVGVFGQMGGRERERERRCKGEEEKLSSLAYSA